MIKTINELIQELIKLRDKHGNVEIKNNDIQLEVIGISYKYLLVKLSLFSKSEEVEDDREPL